MHRFLRWRYLIVPIFIALLVYSAMFAMKNIPFNLFPSRGATVMFVNIEAPNGSSASYTENIVIDVENHIVNEIGEDLKSYTSTIGSYFTNRADIEIALTPTSDRERTAEDMQEKLKALVAEVEGAEEIKVSLLRPGPPQPRRQGLLRAANQHAAPRPGADDHPVHDARLAVHGVEPGGADDRDQQQQAAQPAPALLAMR